MSVLKASLYSFILSLGSLLPNSSSGQLQNIIIYQKDSTLTSEFIRELCEAARTKAGEGKAPSYLEQLINKAAGTYYKDSNQHTLSLKWHKKYAVECMCEEKKKFERGDFIRQTVQSNFREFANIIGPNNRLALDLSFRDPIDSLNVFDYVNAKRIALEEKHKNQRFEFQQDKKWRNIMFFYFLFSEFSIN